MKARVARENFWSYRKNCYRTYYWRNWSDPTARVARRKFWVLIREIVLLRAKTGKPSSFTPGGCTDKISKCTDRPSQEAKWGRPPPAPLSYASARMYLTFLFRKLNYCILNFLKLPGIFWVPEKLPEIFPISRNLPFPGNSLESGNPGVGQLHYTHHRVLCITA